MNKEQTNYLRMFLNVQTTMDENTSLWNVAPVMVTVKNQFDELVQRIAQVNERTNPKSSGVTASKEKLKTIVGDKGVVLSGILQAYAAFNNDDELLAKVKLTRSDVYNARETEVEKIIAPIISEARSHLGELADFMLTEAMIVELETSLDNFKEKIGQPRFIRNQAFAAMTLLDELFDAANDLLKTKLDKLMIRFESVDTEFYSKYQRARTIVD